MVPNEWLPGLVALLFLWTPCSIRAAGTATAQLHMPPNDLLGKKSLRECGEDLLLVFVHVPKSGGSTLRNQLLECTRSHNRKLAWGTVDFLKLSPEEQKKYMAIQAHQGFGIHMQPGFPVYRRKCTHYMTVLDSTPHRIWSQYTFANRKRKERGQPPMSTVEFFNWKRGGHMANASPVEKPHTMWSTDPWSLNNSMTWQVCCWHNSQHNNQYTGGTDNRTLRVIQRTRFSSPFDIDPHCPRTVEARLACAARRLCTDYSIVGIRKGIRGVVGQVATLMGCTHTINTHQLLHANSATRGEPLGDTDLAFIMSMMGEATAADETLYYMADRIAQGDTSVCGGSNRRV